MTYGGKHGIEDTVLKLLRRIGWDHWDPIEIRSLNDVAWQNGAADEYDSYMCEAYRRILAGNTPEAVALYLDGIMENDMSFGAPTPAMHASSVRTVLAISRLVDGNASDVLTPSAPRSPIGSSFQSFLEEEGIAEECNATALKKLAALREI